MEWRGTPPPNGTASPSFPVTNTSANRQLGALSSSGSIPLLHSRVKASSPAPSSRSKKQTPSPAPETPQPQPAPAIFSLIGPVIWTAANVLMAPATSYNGGQTTGQQNQGTQSFVTNDALRKSTPPPGFAPLNQGSPSSQTVQPLNSPPSPPLSGQQRNNNDVFDDLSIDLETPPRPSRNPSWPPTDSSMAPSRSGSSGVSIMSSAWASTTVESGNEDAFEVTSSTPTHRTQRLIKPCFERLMEKRKPANLRGKVVIPDPSKPINRGGYGSIHMGNFGDRKVAVKMLHEMKAKESDDRKKSDDELKTERTNERRLGREINVWAALKHRNICELLGFADDHHDYLVMVSPYYKRGSAANFLKNPVSLDDRIRLTREVCEGLQYLHRFSIVHGDLKPANVLIDDDGVAKLCDFGLVKLEDWGGPPGMTTTSPYSGTMRYKPPELFHGQGIWWPEATFKADMYSLGCVMVEFIEEVRPFNRFDKRKDMEEAIRKHETPVLRTETELALGDVSEQFWMLLEACWDIAESRRPDVETVVGYLDWF